MKNLDNIFTLIEKHGMQQKDLAKEINISPSVFSDWKKGRIKPSIDVLAKIADYFNVSTDYLLGKTDNPAPAGIAYVMDYNENDLVIEVSPEDREKLLKLMDVAFDQGIEFDEKIAKWKISKEK